MELYTAIINTLLVCLLCMAVAVPVGTLLSLLLMRVNIFGRRWAWLAVSSQLAVPLYVFAGGWSAGFGLQGWLSASSTSIARMALGAGSGSLLAVSLIHAAAAIPWVCLITSLGLIWTCRSQEDLATIDGGAGHVLRLVVLPKLRIWIVASCYWCVLPVLTEMVVTNLYQVPTVTEQVYLDVSRGTLSPWTYVASVLFCAVPLFLAGQFFWRTGSAWRELICGLSYHRSNPLLVSGWTQWCLSGVVWLLVLLLVGLPIFNLVTKAGWQPYVVPANGTSIWKITDSDLSAGSLLGSVTRYSWRSERFFTTLYESLTLFGAEFYWTGLLAICSSSVALLLASLLASITHAAWARMLVGSLMLTLVSVPGPLVGIGIIYLMNRNQPAWLGQLYDTTLAAPIFAQQFRLLPLAWVLSLTIAASISRRTWEQAAVDNLGRKDVFFRVVLPQTWTRWLAAGLLLAVTSVGELSCSILVLPPGVTTVSMRLFELLHFGMRHQDSGLCGVLMLLGWAVSLTTWKTLNER